MADIEKILIEHSAAIMALQTIARGRPDNGRPLGQHTSMQVARMTLAAIDVDWTEAAKAARG